MGDHIFISYSRTDGSNFANRLYEYLHNNGYKPWLDTRDIKPGDVWAEKSDIAIRTCWLLLFIASPEGVRSRTCAAEWSRALRFKKPVVPLVYDRETEMPLLLEQRQYISMAKSREKGMEELLQHLSFLRSPDGELSILQSRYYDLELDLKRNPNPKIIKREMRQLKEQIDFKKRVLEEPDIQISNYKKTVELGILREREQFAKERQGDRAIIRRRVIGTSPLGVNKIFKDREPEKTQIINSLLSSKDIRLVSIYGKAGSGKTALACRVMQELENRKGNVFGVTYHSTQNGNLNFEQIYFACSRILGGHTEKKLIKVWESSEANVELKIESLLASVQHHRIVILLDNLEVLQGKDGELIDHDLKMFVDTFLSASLKTRILLTSRELLKISTEKEKYEKVIPLDEGLPINHAVELLIELGKNGNLELSQPTKSTLRSAAKLAFGYPRALEAIVGILGEDPNLSLEELLKQTRIFNKRVLDNLVKEAYSRLSVDSQLVIQALAVFERPASPTGLMYMLEPYAATLDVSGELNRLVRKYFVKVNRKTDEYVIHPLDREYSYNLISRDQENPYNITALEQRAASYYSLLQTPPETWSSIADVEPQLLAFPHLCKAEAFDDAARLINAIDSKHLIRWGYLTLVIKMRQRLVGRIKDERLAGMNYAALCEAYRRLGQGDKAIEFGKLGVEVAERINDRSLENVCLGYLGRTLRNLGRVQEAVEYLERALGIAREIGDRSSEGRHIGNLGSCYYNLGDFEHSIALLEQSIEINKAIGDNGEVTERTGHLGNPHFHLGNYDKAIELYNNALTMSRGLRQRRGEGYWLWLLGRAHSNSGSPEKGAEFLRQSLEIAKAVEDVRLECFVLGTFVETYLQLKQPPQALNMAEMAVNIDVPELNANSAAMYGIILARLGNSKSASKSLHRAILLADGLLKNTKRFFEAKYTRALSFAALSTLAQNEEKKDLLQEAEYSYLDAIASCNANGVVARNVRLLGELRDLDKSNSLQKLIALFSIENK